MSVEEDYGWWEQELHAPVSLCNYCSLQRLYERAGNEGKWVKLVKCRDGWTEVHAHEYGEQLTDPDTHPGTWRCSFMQLSDHCVC